VTAFRRLLCAWTVVYLGARLPHVEELYCRPVLREGLLPALAVPPPPSLLVTALFAAALLALVPLALGRRERLAWAVFFPAYLAIFVLDPMMPRGYGTLSVVQWGILGLPPAVAATLLRLQWSSVYLFTVVAKLAAGGWWDGTALWVSLRNDRYGDFLLSGGGVSRGLALALSWGALALEVFAPIGAWWPRTRGAAAAACVALHLGILLTMRISPLFHALMVIHLPLFFGEGSPRRS
jgi:hypothetical protein